MTKCGNVKEGAMTTHPFASATVAGAPVFLTVYAASTTTIDLLDLTSLNTISVDQKEGYTKGE